MDHEASVEQAFRGAMIEEQERLERKYQEERVHELLAQELQKQLEYDDLQEQRAPHEERQQNDVEAHEQASSDNLARQLQQELDLEDTLHQKRLREVAEREMESSAAGKAWKFVERVHELHRTKTQLYGERPVGVDEMVFLAERMFEEQEDFRERGLPSRVDLGYHYTSKANMAQIRTDGLLSKVEREAKNIVNNFNGESYGPGIYTGNDAKKFSQYGTVGLIVARLKGKAMDPISSGRQYTRGNTSIMAGPLVVLQKSSQCLALIQFRRRYADEVVQAYTADLYAIIDEFFNGDDGSQIPLSCSPQSNQSLANLLNELGAGKKAVPVAVPATFHTINKAELTLGRKPTRRVFRNPDVLFHYKAPSSLREGDPRGTMPSGNMCVFSEPTYTCAGFSPGTIVIRYNIPAAIQRQYHENAGWKHSSARREAYLPDNETGRHLARRLQFAFMNGHTFTIGTSETTKHTNSVVWSSIPHKTRRVGGPHGFPDPQYFRECNSRLDSLGVPRECSDNKW